MVGGIFYEHGHRMIASTVGFLTIILAAWTWRVEPRRWLRRLGVIALVAVILQGVLGGITVLYRCRRQCRSAMPGWRSSSARRSRCRCSRRWMGQARDPVRDLPRRRGADDHLLVYVQILLGATMRHNRGRHGDPGLPARVRPSRCRRSGTRRRGPLRAPRRRRGNSCAILATAGHAGITIADAASWRGRPRSSSCWCWCR